MPCGGCLAKKDVRDVGHSQSQASSESQLGHKQGYMSLAVGRRRIGCPSHVLRQGKLTVQAVGVGVGI